MNQGKEFKSLFTLLHVFGRKLTNLLTRARLAVYVSMRQLAS